MKSISMKSENKGNGKRNYRIKSYHNFYKRKGIYRFFYKNTIKLFVFLALIVGVLLFVKWMVPDLDQQLELYLSKFNTLAVLVFFLLSETLLGLIPPDFFIVWAQGFDAPYLWVGIIACLSYLGGVFSFFIGKYIGQIPSIEKWIIKNFLKHFDLIKKWGGVLIIFAALFPLPFSPVCIAAGSVRFPFKTFLLLGLFRFMRFFGYAIVLFSII